MNSEVDRLPFGLGWEITPASWQFDGNAARVRVAGRTDNFVDPTGSVVALNGARAVAVAPQKPWQFAVRVTVDFRASYDAGTVMLWSEERQFAKLCFEQSPQGRATVVSVVTRDLSDDSNAWTVAGDSVWLRVCSLGHDAYVFHSSPDSAHWDLVRYFALAGNQPMKYGIGAQSPIGNGCDVTFTEFSFAATLLTDLRDGS